MMTNWNVFAQGKASEIEIGTITLAVTKKAADIAKALKTLDKDANVQVQIIGNADGTVTATVTQVVA